MSIKHNIKMKGGNNIMEDITLERLRDEFDDVIAQINDIRIKKVKI